MPESPSARLPLAHRDTAPPMPDEDEQDRIDVDAALAGDEVAFASIIERHNVAIQKQMRNFTRDPGLMEELTQDVFVEAYLGLAKYRGDAPFRHWLARIATLTGYKFWKKRDREKRTVHFPEGFEPAMPEAEDRGRPEEAAQLLFDLLATLPADDRLAMTLMYLEHMSQDAIAERRGWTRVMVAVRLYRAKQRLRKLGEKEPWKGRLSWIPL
ncbi:MAG: sigma-70 family RNA polymerase sigma factor [Planctomycetes bacterium]|nr:sigma-70 family RNA polymerase sigma factor [Planctomycetota bacterium]